MSLRFGKDINNKDILLNSNNDQVMMEWEQCYMEKCIDILKPQGDVLEIGFGLGYSANHIQLSKPESHTIIECDKNVLEKLEEWSQDKPNVKIVKGYWQTELDKLGIFDEIFFDDYPRNKSYIDHNRINLFMNKVLTKHSKIGTKISYYTEHDIKDKDKSCEIVTEEFKTQIPDNCNYCKQKKVYTSLITKICETAVDNVYKQQYDKVLKSDKDLQHMMKVQSTPHIYLSAALICKNEEDVIERCINTLTDHVDEIQICDTGSTDNTLELIKKLNNPKVHIHTDYEWNKNFAEARNHANSKCSGVWIISVDCDSVLKTTINIKKHLRTLSYEVGVVNVWNDWGNAQFYFPKIYRNIPEIYYKYNYHNALYHKCRSVPTKNIMFCEKRNKNSSVGRSERQKDLIEYFEKMNEKDAKDTRSWFYIARTYMDNAQYEKAIKKFEHYVTIATWYEEKYIAYLYCGRCYKKLSKDHDAIRMWTQGYEVDTKRNEIVCELMETYKSRKMYNNAMTWWRNFNPDPPERTLFVEGHYTEWLGYDTASLIHWYLDDFETATELAEKALEGNNIDRIRNNIEVYKKNIEGLKKNEQNKQDRQNAWEISDELYKHILEILPKGSTILELGSGTGTKKLTDDYTVYSVEHDTNWLNKVDTTNYIYAPLKNYSISKFPKHKQWYDIDILKDKIPKKYDLILVDGPPGGVGRGGFHKFLDMFNTNVPIIFDDICRNDEKKLIELISKKINREYEDYNKYGVIEGKKKLLIYTGKSRNLWNSTKYYKEGLGGSETAVVNLAKEFSNSYEVIVSGDVEDEDLGDVNYVNSNKLQKVLDENKFDIVIVSRYIDFLTQFRYQSRKTYVWVHDCDFITIFNNKSDILKKYDDKIDKYICLTSWHVNNMLKYYPHIEPKIEIIGNGIQPDLFPKDKINKVKNRFVYTSCPNRGLDNVLELWPDIKKILPDAELLVCTYQLNFPRGNNKLEIDINKSLEKCENVKFLGKKHPEELYKILATAEYWFYPTYFPETYCITALEIMYSKVTALYYPSAGLTETMNEYGFQITKGKDIEEICEIIKETVEKQEKLDGGFAYAQQKTWKNRCQEWLKLFEQKDESEFECLGLVDSPGNDICCVGKKPIKDLERICLEKGGVAFTSFGWIKNKIGKDLTETKTSMLYVKTSSDKTSSNKTSSDRINLSRNKIIDAFIFYNELEILDLRLHELYDVVDYFVLVEANYTFSGNPKPFYFEENKEKYSKYLNKIIHIKVTDMPNNNNAWDNEHFQRRAIIRSFDNFSDQDIIMISDADEIPRASVIKNLDKSKLPFALNQIMYYYNYENEKDALWCGTKIHFVKDLIKNDIQNTRNIITKYRNNIDKTYTVIENGGWHFSYFGGNERIKKKIEDFSHQEHNTSEVLDKIEYNVKNKKDLFNRKHEKITVKKIDETYPVYVQSKELVVIGTYSNRDTYLNDLKTSIDTHCSGCEFIIQKDNMKINENMEKLRQKFIKSGKRYWVFLDDDIMFLENDTIYKALKFMIDGNYAVVGVHEVYSKNVLTNNQFRSKVLKRFKNDFIKDIPWIPGYFMMVDSKKIGDIEFDLDNPAPKGQFTDINYCFAVKSKKFKIGVTNSVVWHLAGMSNSKDLSKKDIHRVQLKQTYINYLKPKWGDIYEKYYVQDSKDKRYCYKYSLTYENLEIKDLDAEKNIRKFTSCEAIDKHTSKHLDSYIIKDVIVE